jgi:hypothetical protein
MRHLPDIEDEFYLVGPNLSDLFTKVNSVARGRFIKKGN